MSLSDRALLLYTSELSISTPWSDVKNINKPKKAGNYSVVPGSEVNKVPYVTDISNVPIDIYN